MIDRPDNKSADSQVPTIKDVLGMLDVTIAVGQQTRLLTQSKSD